MGLNLKTSIAWKGRREVILKIEDGMRDAWILKY